MVRAEAAEERAKTRLAAARGQFWDLPGGLRLRVLKLPGALHAFGFRFPRF